jgi:hypothetical protein
MREPPQLLVDQRDKIAEGAFIALRPALQQLGDMTRRVS